MLIFANLSPLLASNMWRTLTIVSRKNRHHMLLVSLVLHVIDIGVVGEVGTVLHVI